MNIQMLKDLGITEEKIIAAIVEAAFDQIDVLELAKKQISSQIKAKLDDMADETVGRVLDEEVRSMLSREIVPVDTWGEKCGEPTTIRAALHNRAMNYWDTNVNSDGKPSTYGTGSTRAEFLMRKIGKEAFDNGIRENASEVVRALRESLSKSLKADVERALNECFLAEGRKK